MKSLKKIGLFLTLTCFVSTMRCGEEQQDQIRIEYEALRQELMAAFTQAITGLTTLRNQHPTDQAFDNAIMPDILNQMFVGLTPQMIGAIRLVFLTTDSPSVGLRRTKHILKYLNSHPYHESEGRYLLDILHQYMDLAMQGMQVVISLQQSILTAPQNQVMGITLMYMIHYNKIREQMIKLLKDMAIVD